MLLKNIVMGRYYIFLSIMAYVNLSFAQPLTNASIIIILDISEYEEKNNFGAQTGSLIQALNQKAAPIITTSFLLNKVFTQKKVILDAYEITADSFDGWIYKKINDLFYLLIPKEYIPGLKTLNGNNRSHDGISLVELKTGIKLDHLKTVKEVDIITLPKNPSIEDFIFSLEDIFVTNKEYSDATRRQKMEKPRWAIYLTGHGSPEEDLPFLFTATHNDLTSHTGNLKVAGLPVGHFRKLLEFLELKLSVGFFFFQTCYSGGKNLEAIYQDVNKIATPKTFNFIIASGALTEAASFTTTTQKKTTKYYFLESVSKKNILLDYRKFFASLQNTNDEPIDFVTTLDYVSNFTRGGKFIANIPLVKFPGSELISTLDIPSKVVSIGKTLARSRDQNQILDISTFFAGRYEKLGQGQQVLKKIYPDVILLYTDEIFFPLKISAKAEDSTPPTLVSMIGGDAVHEFAKIDASQFKLFDIMKSFFPFVELQPQKIFLIRELICQKDSRVTGMPQTSLITLNNVIFYNAYDPINPDEPMHTGAYFTASENYYAAKKINYSAKTIKINPIAEYMDEWLYKLATIKSQNALHPESLFASNLEELKKFIERRPKLKELSIEEALFELFNDLQQLYLRIID